MAKQILVPLKKDDCVEEIIPYVERVAQPGMKVVFLLPYPVYGLIWGRKDFGIEAVLEARNIVAYYTWDVQKRLAEQKVSPARETLHQRGVETALDLCGDPLRKAVARYTRNGDVHLIVMRPGLALRIKRFLQGVVPDFSASKRPGFSPVLVVHPGTLV